MKLPFGLEWVPRKAPRPPADWVGPGSFADWEASDIDYVSKAMRSHGQPESEGFRRFARVALNTLRSGSAIELVARAIEASANPGCDPERPITGGHYLHGMPAWCVWVEYARQAVAAVIQRARQPRLLPRQEARRPGWYMPVL
jgi:hypothetical protein